MEPLQKKTGSAAVTKRKGNTLLCEPDASKTHGKTVCRPTFRRQTVRKPTAADAAFFIKSD